MKIWLTPPFSDDPPEEIETIGEPSDACIQHRLASGSICWTNWYAEGSTWHRTREEAVRAANLWRRQRIDKARAEADRLAALPVIS